MKITEKITSPNQSTRDGIIPQLVVLHIADGTYEGTKSWFANPASQTSSHFIVARDGRICQCVDLMKMAWCNGTTTNSADGRYFGHSSVELVEDLGGNANKYSISIECEGYWKETQGALTEKQLEAVIWLIKYIRDEVKRIYNHTILFDRRYVVGHNEITPKTRANCPGQKFPWEAIMMGLRNKPVETSVLYRVQVGSFINKPNADNYLKNTVIPKGVRAFIVEGVGVDNKPRWRIQVGLFEVKKNAENYLGEVKKKGLEAFLVYEEK